MFPLPQNEVANKMNLKIVWISTTSMITASTSTTYLWKCVVDKKKHLWRSTNPCWERTTGLHGGNIWPYGVNGVNLSSTLFSENCEHQQKTTHLTQKKKGPNSLFVLSQRWPIMMQRRTHRRSNCRTLQPYLPHQQMNTYLLMTMKKSSQWCQVDKN